MRVSLEFEIPNWTRWVAIAAAVGVALGYGVAAVQAAAVSVTTTWKPGAVLTAEALNKNFQDIQDALNAQQALISAQQVTIDALTKAAGNPDCPLGYARDTVVSNIVLCKKGTDQVVKVGTGGSTFWIDRFEASIWSNSNGTGTQYGTPTVAGYPATFPVNGQYSAPLFALSIANVTPSANLTWFQAVAACAANGKRLPSREEWFRAAAGTPDPDTSDGTGGTCFTAGGDWPRETGLGTACISSAGAQDMIGNLSEFTDEWYASIGNDGLYSIISKWPGEKYFGDYLVNVSSTVGTNDGATSGVYGLPAVSHRGGTFADGERAGIFAMDAQFAPTFYFKTVGVRCVVPK